MIRLAHISDLHFAAQSFSPMQFLSKRWVANFYMMLSRKKKIDSRHLPDFPDLFSSRKIDYVLITGDLTTTSSKREFQRAAGFVKALEDQGLKVVAIPGNHDHYTKKAYKKKLFYDFFSPYEENGFSLKEDGVALIPLQNHWTLLALDCALATSLVSSNGHFDPKAEAALKRALQEMSPTENIIVMNHFPLFERKQPRKALLRAEALRNILSSFPNIRFYLHGHTHDPCVADLRASRFPIILDSGSSSHIERGSWNLLELTRETAALKVYHKTHLHSSHSFSWDL